MFDKILGNDKIKFELINSIKLGKYSHSYLFLGISGIGKKMIAREFAKMILCDGEEKYCNKCKSCLEFDSNNNPDFIEIDARWKQCKNRTNKRNAKKDCRTAYYINKKSIYNR